MLSVTLFTAQTWGQMSHSNMNKRLQFPQEGRLCSPEGKRKTCSHTAESHKDNSGCRNVDALCAGGPGMRMRQGCGSALSTGHGDGAFCESA